MICKSTLDKLGKAAFNNLSPEDQQKYTTASSIVTIITGVISGGSISGAVADTGIKLVTVGLQAGSAALISLSAKITGKTIKSLTEAITALSDYIATAALNLIDQIKHDIANKLAVLFGINENPGIIGAIMEWIYKSIVKPALTAI